MNDNIPVRVNAIVSSPVSSRYGVVREVFQYGRRILAAVHFIDPNTGNLLECPDKGRCKHERTCPIHGVNVDVHDLQPWPAKDVAFYVNEGMVSPAIARLATCATITIQRRTSHKYKITAAKDGFVCNSITITSEDHNDEWQLCVALCNAANHFSNTTLNDPDTEDYKTLEALFAATPLGTIN